MIPAIVGFDWDGGNREKCQKHGLTIAVIENLLRSPLGVFPDPQHSKREERFKAIGRTEDGRAVFIVFTLRGRDGETLIRRSAPVTCVVRRLIIMKKKLPKLQTDEEAEEFVANADLTEYDLSQFRTVLFEFQPKSERVNMRLPKTLLDAVKASATRAGVPYQRFIRQVLEAAVRSSAES